LSRSERNLLNFGFSLYLGALPDSDASLIVEERPFQGRVGKETASNAALKRRSSTNLPSALFWAKD
jgi:hypothetical protein